MEVMAPRYVETVAILLPSSFSAFGISLISVVGYLFGTWVEYYVVLASLIVISIPFIVAVPRSFRWYFSQK